MADPHAPASGGHGGGGGSKLANAWGYAILLIVLVFANVLGQLSGQLNSFFQMAKLNLGIILIFMAFMWFRGAAKG
jgi:hypothetical protein